MYVKLQRKRNSKISAGENVVCDAYVIATMLRATIITPFR
jgi:hypothetical protein